MCGSVNNPVGVRKIFSYLQIFKTSNLDVSISENLINHTDPNRAKRIVLIGFMGSGKSHVGAELSAILNFHFIDLDSKIEELENSKVSEIFDYHGEAYFREKEAMLLRNILSNQSNIVLSTGGGTPCYRDNMAFILLNAISFYLKPPIGLLCSRLINQTANRPLLNSSASRLDLEASIISILAQRNHYYQMADFCIEFDEHSQHQVVDKILQSLP